MARRRRMEYQGEAETSEAAPFSRKRGGVRRGFTGGFGGAAGGLLMKYGKGGKGVLTRRAKRGFIGGPVGGPVGGLAGLYRKGGY